MGLTCKAWEPKEASIYAKMDADKMKHIKESKKTEDKKDTKKK